MENEKTGYIYVLTNESFHRENWIKIGYAEDVEKGLRSYLIRLYHYLLKCTVLMRYQE